MKKPKSKFAPKYTQSLANKICDELAEGKSLATVCKGENMPNTRSVYRWLRSNDKFREQYYLAKQEGTDALIEQIQDIANDKELHPNDKRVRIDAFRWIASRLKPAKYGDHIKQEITGKDGESLPVIVKQFVLPEKTDEKTTVSEGPVRDTGGTGDDKGTAETRLKSDVRNDEKPAIGPGNPSGRRH